MSGSRNATALLTAIVLALPAAAQQNVQVQVQNAQLVQVSLRPVLPLNLLMNPSVQKELKLSDEQVEKIKKVVPEFAKLTDLKPDERKDKVQKILADILQPAQSQRLRQIEVQQRGLSDPDNQQALKLTEEQKERIKSVNQELGKELRDIFSKDGRSKDAMEKVQKARQTSREKMVNILTDDQKKTWKEMAGEPFDLLPGPAIIGGVKRLP